MILTSAPPASLILSILAAAAYGWPAARTTRVNEHVARFWVGLAWLIHGAVLAITLLGDNPHFGFAPAMSVTAWLVAAIYAVESQIFPQLPTRWTLCVVGAAAVLAAAVFPGSPIPVTASAWLAVHLAFGVACYDVCPQLGCEHTERHGGDGGDGAGCGRQL